MCIRDSRYPVGACQFVETNHLQGRLYNSYEFGGYIEWALGAALPVLMDGRYIFHRMLAEHRSLNDRLYDDPSDRMWTSYIDHENFEMAITNYGDFEIPWDPLKSSTPLSLMEVKFPSEMWALVYWDDTALLYLKRLPQYNKVIEEYEYRALLPANIKRMEMMLASKALSLSQVKAELARHEKQVGPSYMARLMDSVLNGK